MERKCDKCGQVLLHFGKGFCKRCYMKQYMQKNYKKMGITTMVIGKDLLKHIRKKSIEGESADATLRRLLGT